MSRFYRILICGLFVVACNSTNASAQRSTAASFSVLELTGIGSTTVSNVAGGNLTADVVESTSGTSELPQKLLGTPRVEPLSFQMPAGQLTQWIKQAMDGTQPGGVNGRLLEVGGTGLILTEQQFSDARLTYVQFPALDASTKEVARIAVKLLPQQTQEVSASSQSTSAAPAGTKTKPPLTSNFQLTIDGLDCSKVLKIAPIVVEYKQQQQAAQRDRHRATSAVRAEHGNLVITIPTENAGSFKQWHQQALQGQLEKKQATVRLLADTGQSILELEGTGVGIITIRRVATQEGATRMPVVEVEMFVERWQAK